MINDPAASEDDKNAAVDEFPDKFHDYHNDVDQYRGDASVAGRSQGSYWRMRKARQRWLGGRSGSPSIGPEGQPEQQAEDPRCQGIKNDVARGTLFMNKYFCKGDDLLTCLVRSQDSLLDITSGKCRETIGPGDRERVTCKQEEQQSGSDSCPNDMPRRPGQDCPGTIGQTIPVDYISTTPLGAMIASMCLGAGGGLCPEDF